MSDPSRTVHRRTLSDGFEYELRRGGEGWEARCLPNGDWRTARSAGFALIFASSVARRDPEKFGREARRWEKELRADE